MLHTISISLDPSTGSFTYSPSTVRATATDTIQWQSAMPFALMFLDQTPIGQMEVCGPPPLGFPPFQIDGQAEGHYHYAVAVWDGARVHIDSGCPDIIIN